MCANITTTTCHQNCLHVENLVYKVTEKYP